MSQIEPVTETSESSPGVSGRWPAADDRGGWPIWQISLARIRDFYRHRTTIFWVYGFPVVMSIALGIAFRERPQATYVVDVQATAGADWVVAALDDWGSASDDGQRDTQFNVRRVDADQGRRRLRIGRSTLLIVPPDEAIAPAGGTQPELEFVFDPTRPESNLARAAVDRALQVSAGRLDPLAVRDVSFDEPGSRYIDFLIPGLIGFCLMGGGLWGIGFVVVDLRVRNLLKRLVTTPMWRSDFLAALMLSRFFFMVTQALLLVYVARWLFGVVVLGSMTLLLVVTVLGSLMFAGLGLLVACRAQTVETVSGIMNLTMMPMWLLSGIFFSTERFPDTVQPLIKLLPLTPLIDALRSIMLEGATLTDVGLDVGLMTAWIVASFFLALRFFRWS